MFKFSCSSLLAAITALLLLSGCATTKAPPKDYSSFIQSRPASILVLPPVNNSPDVEATASVYAQVSRPLATSGYYVLPVALVDETFRQNGLTEAAEIHALSPAKLREIFAADAALYLTVEQYGTRYQVLSSVTQVTLTGRLVDLKTGQSLWTNEATVVEDSGSNNSNGLLGMLISAAVNQIANTVSNRSHPVAGSANVRLLSAGQPNGLLYGPRSPNYRQEGVPAGR